MLAHSRHSPTRTPTRPAPSPHRGGGGEGGRREGGAHGERSGAAELQGPSLGRACPPHEGGRPTRCQTSEGSPEGGCRGGTRDGGRRQPQYAGLVKQWGSPRWHPNPTLPLPYPFPTPSPFLSLPYPYYA